MQEIKIQNEVNIETNIIKTYKNFEKKLQQDCENLYNDLSSYPLFSTLEKLASLYVANLLPQKFKSKDLYLIRSDIDYENKNYYIYNSLNDIESFYQTDEFQGLKYLTTPKDEDIINYISRNFDANVKTTLLDRTDFRFKLFNGGGLKDAKFYLSKEDCYSFYKKYFKKFNKQKLLIYIELIRFLFGGNIGLAILNLKSNYNFSNNKNYANNIKKEIISKLIHYLSDYIQIDENIINSINQIDLLQIEDLYKFLVNVYNLLDKTEIEFSLLKKHKNQFHDLFENYEFCNSNIFKINELNALRKQLFIDSYFTHNFIL